MARIILHIDMDYFFAQVEERENPQFKGKPVVVGADPAPARIIGRYGAGPKEKVIMKATGRGVVSTANYKARKYGIHSALPISKAYELCPEAIFLPVDFRLYEEVSEKIMNIIKKYSPKWEIAGLDEAYLDISQVNYKGTEVLAKKLKKEILEKEKLTSTVGVGPNKLIAKMATNKAKPDGLLIIKSDQVSSFLDPLDIQDLHGIGPKTAQVLRNLGVNKVKELKKLSKSDLGETFGKIGEAMYEKARGIDKDEVLSEGIIKSIGKEFTFERDTRNSEIIFKIFDKIIENVYQQLKDNNFSFKTLTVICRYQGFETHTKSKTLNPVRGSKDKEKKQGQQTSNGVKEPVQSLEILKKESKKLLLKFLVENQKLIRLIGLRVSNLY